VGLAVESEGAGRAALTFSPEDEQRFSDLARDPDIYPKAGAQP
jgi:DNA replication licensing factor MCM5